MLKDFTVSTGRMISFKTGLESNVVGRCLNTLKKQDLIEEAYREKCQVSKKVEPGVQGRMNF
jgi:hypothetical protein